jgi:hypothetical protein
MRALAIAAVLTLSCAPDSDAEWPCEPEQCYSCELGYYGSLPVPVGATRVHVDAADRTMGAHITYQQGDPNAGTAMDIGRQLTFSLPSTFELVAGTERIIVLGPPGLTVAYDACAASR